jgi:hypothetical protein
MRLAKSGAARFLIRFVILGAAAGTLAGWGAHVVRSAVSLPAAPDESASEPKAWQVSNRGAKGDRLALIQAAFNPSAHGAVALPADPSPTYALAAATPTAELDRVPNAAAAPMGAVDAQSPALAYAAEPAVAALPLPPKRPKHMPAPESGLLDDAHIAGIKGRLRLTAEQQEYWPAVEAALREVGRTYFGQIGKKQAYGGKPQIDVNSPEVQRLIWAAMPLLRQLREDQKNEVRKLARVIGLHSVASQI